MIKVQLLQRLPEELWEELRLWRHMEITPLAHVVLGMPGVHVEKPVLSVQGQTETPTTPRMWRQIC